MRSSRRDLIDRMLAGGLVSDIESPVARRVVRAREAARTLGVDEPTGAELVQAYARAVARIVAAEAEIATPTVPAKPCDTTGSACPTSRRPGRACQPRCSRGCTHSNCPPQSRKSLTEALAELAKAKRGADRRSAVARRAACRLRLTPETTRVRQRADRVRGVGSFARRLERDTCVPAADPAVY
jgi:hypothetical protein